MVMKRSSSPRRSSGSIPLCSTSNKPAAASAHRRRAIRSGAKMHAAYAFIAQIQLGKRGLVAARKRRLGAALLLQPGEREFDVLAGPQLAGGVIGA